MSRLERFVDVPGGRLWTATDGDGPPVVLLHAGIVDGRVWEPFVPLLTREGCRVVWYDARPYHRSTTEDVPFSHVDDLEAVVDAYGLKRVTLVGNSLGGNTALEFAVDHPERVAALVMLASGIPRHEVPISSRDEAVMTRYREVDGSGDLEALTDFELALWGAGVEQPVERLPVATRAFLRPMIGDANELAVRGRPADREPVVDRLDRLAMPVVFVHGGFDFGHTETHGHILEERAPDARVVVWPDTAHMIAVEKPAETARLVLDTIRPLGRYG